MTEERRMSFGNLDNLDELGSFNGSDSQASPSQRSRKNIQSIDYNPVGLTIGQTSPGGRSTNSDISGPYSRNQSHSVHGVHMHVQENAKIPTLGRQPVDRTNSSVSRISSYTPLPLDSASSTGGGGDGTGGINTEEFSMAELFLSKESKIRRSLDQNYSSLGTLLNDVGLTGAQRRPSADGSSISAKSDKSVAGGKNSSNSVDETQMEIDALTAAIDPTPWSEIEQKIHKDEEQRYKKTYPTSAPAAPSAPVPNQYYSYYPYGRQHQLPIPGKPSSFEASANSASTASKPSPPPLSSSANGAAAPTLSTMEQAVATAAAIAASTSTGGPKVPSVASTPKTAAAAPAHAPYTKAQQTTATSATASAVAASAQQPRHYHRQRATYTPAPPHAVAHTTARSSVLAAASQKSQYGFGGNHTVPGVPQAPPPIGGGSKIGKNKRKNAPPPPTIPSAVLPGIPNLNARPGGGLAGVAAIHAQHHPPNAGAAYERKKQRAKDARVKLNDAIERLSVSMNVSGSQSKLRYKLLQTKILPTDARAKSLQASDNCVKLAEQAKKWDRPSFVGTAASLVQGLNTQCEALMNEITILDQRLKSMEGGGGGGAAMNGGEGDDMDVVMADGDELNNHKHPLNSSMNGLSTKRIKQEDNDMENHSSSSTSSPAPLAMMAQKQQPQVGGSDSGNSVIQHVTASSDEKIIFNNIAKMLDPISLCRCSCVSRKWRDMEAFDDDDIWLRLAVARFGFVNLRQWTEKLEDDAASTTNTNCDSISTTAVNGRGGGGGCAGEAGGSTSATTTATTTSKNVRKKKLYRAMNAANIMPHVQQESVSLLGDAKIPGRVSVWAFMVERSNGETLRSVMREPGNGQQSNKGGGQYHSSPVVELRIIIQNTGMASYPIVLKKQSISIDVSTRRTGGEFKEISWDDRFAKVVRNLDGTIRKPPIERRDGSDSSAMKYHGVEDELCRLSLFESSILEVHINARGCSTTSKFQQRSNFTKLLVFFDGTTVPMVVPFLRDAAQVKA